MKGVIIQYFFAVKKNTKSNKSPHWIINGLFIIRCKFPHLEGNNADVYNINIYNFVKGI